MVLKLEGPRIFGFGFTTTCRTLEFNLVMDFDAIVENRRFSGSNFFTSFIKLGSYIINIVSLPNKWRKTGVNARFELGVDATTLVVFAFKTKTVKDLHFVAVLQIKA